MNLLVTIAYHASNAPQTEKLLDFIYQQSNRVALGHVLLASAPDVHQELRTRIRISAELAFAGVHEIELRPLTDPQAGKVAQVNNAFRQVAAEVREHFNWPFFWLEPDCTPYCADWLDKIWLAYSNQPKAFFGTRMKLMADKPEEESFFMARVGVYPPNVMSLVFMNESKGPFEIYAAPTIVPSLTATKMIQQTSILTADDLSKVRPDAVLVHGDKNGHLLRKIEADVIILKNFPTKWGLPILFPRKSDDCVPDSKPEPMTLADCDKFGKDEKAEPFNPTGEVLIPITPIQPEPETSVPVTPIKRGRGRPRKFSLISKTL